MAAAILKAVHLSLEAMSKLTGEHYCPEIASSVRTALQASAGLSNMQLKRCEKKSIIPFDFTYNPALSVVASPLSIVSRSFVKT